jgi:hypothetical protein
MIVKTTKKSDASSGAGLRQRRTWQDFFKLTSSIEIPDDFISDRNDAPPDERKILVPRSPRRRDG